MAKLGTLVAVAYLMTLLTSALLPNYTLAEQVSLNDDEGRTMQKTMDRSKIHQDFVAAAKFLKKNKNSNGKLGATGFCFGGYIVNYLAAVDSELLTAGVPFYGTPAKKK